MPITTLTQIPSAVSEFYDKVLLTRALPYSVHDKFGQRRPLPPKSSTVIKFRKFNALPPTVVPLSEGVTPTGAQLSISDITAIIRQYGDFVEITDMVNLVNRDPVLTEAAELLGEQAGQSLDRIIRDIIVAGTNVQYSNGVTRSAVNTAISIAILNKVIRTLNNANAKTHTKIITAGTGIGTTPIRPAYFAIVHPDVQYDLENLTGYKSVEEYASQNAIVEGEIGAYKNIRFVSTTEAKIWSDAGGAAGAMKSTTGTNADVYATLVFGTDAYGITEIRGGGLENIVKTFGSGGTADPLDQRATSGWKATLTAKILNDTFMVRIECAATA